MNFQDETHEKMKKPRGPLPEQRRKTKVSVKEYGNEGANNRIGRQA